MKCPISYKKLLSILTGILICFFLIRGVQFYLKLNYKSDFRVEMLGIITNHPFEGDNTGMHLRKIQLRFKMENFELIQMMNETTPNMISDDALLVISASHSSVQSSYAHLLQKIQVTCETNNTLPFYLLRKTRGLLMQNSKSIAQETNQIVKVLQYFTESLMIKRLTILSFEQGSLLTLRCLALMKYDVFSIIDKIILVNAFNPITVIFHSNAACFLEQTKQMILSDPIRTQLVNGTRIIIIHTIDNNAGDRKLNWLFKNTNGQSITFANSLVVQSKHMWNVYSYLKPDEYFRFQPFVELLTKFLHEDRNNWPLSIKQINYLLLYREVPDSKQLSIQKRNKIMAKCADYYMQNYSIDGIFFNGECMRLLRKEDFFFNQYTTIIIRSLGKFQVYGQNYEKLTPYDTKDKEMVYLLENVMNFRRIFIINTRRFAIHVMIQPSLRPEIVVSKSLWMSSSILSQNKLYYYFRTVFNKNTTEPVNLCPGHTILHPSNITLYNIFLYQNSQLSLQNNLDCYWSIDSYISLLKNLQKYWSLGFNLIVFSLFNAHVIKKSTFSRFYYQYLINSLLTYLHTGEYLFSENFIILAIVVAVQQILKLATLMSNMIYMPKKLVNKVIWLPMLFQILKWMNFNTFLSSWKALGLIFFAGTRKSNIIILFLKFTFVMQYIICDFSHPQSLFLCCVWLANSSQQSQLQTQTQPEQPKQFEQSPLIILTTGRNTKHDRQQIIRKCKQIIDTITICIIALCLSQDGVILHHLLDFYIVSFMIFALHQQVQNWN